MTPDAFVFIATLLFRSSEPPKPPLFGTKLKVTVEAEDERACKAFRAMLMKEFGESGVRGAATTCAKLKPEPIAP